MIKNRVLIWISGTDSVMRTNVEKAFIGGMQVQMFMWAKTFENKFWDVIAFTDMWNHHKRKINGITYYYYPHIPILGPFISVFLTFYCLLRLKPSTIIINGATRDLFFVTTFSNLIGSKVIEVFASNSDLEPGDELIKRNLDRLLYRWGIYKTDNFIVQNTFQSELLKEKYKKKNYIIIPFIWVNDVNLYKITKNRPKDIILWVANFRSLKRPEWFIRIANQNHNKKFVMVGNPIDQSLFEKCRQLTMELSNIELIPGLCFLKTGELFKHARLFVCTSETEGFPNTFIQSWMNGCPVLSTFDPSNLIKINNLGHHCTTLEDFNIAIQKFDDPEYFNIVSDNCISYYFNHFSADNQYDKIIRHFKLS
jgi:glycosyltransferase involved in cell wall biosynthesis